MSVFNPAFIWIACGSATNLQDIKCHSIAEYEVVLFPDHNKYDNWRHKAVRYDFDISRDCEVWCDKGLIFKGDDIADYYLNLTEKVNAEVVKIDSDWEEFVLDNPHLNLDF